jgi:AAA family ATP:ADP antiporter
MELAAVSSKGICIDDVQGSTELSPTGYMILQDISIGIPDFLLLL